VIARLGYEEAAVPQTDLLVKRCDELERIVATLKRAK